MDTSENVMLDRYTLTLNHEYEFIKDGKISRVKADEPLCISYVAEHTSIIPAQISIGDMMDKLKYELLKRMMEE